MKKRVFELAKELGIDSKQMIQRLRESGMQVESHLTYLSDEEQEKARKLLETPRPGEMVVKKIGGTVVRRRAGVPTATQAAPAPSAATPPPAAPAATPPASVEPPATPAVPVAAQQEPEPTQEEPQPALQGEAPAMAAEPPEAVATKAVAPEPAPAVTEVPPPPAETAAEEPKPARPVEPPPPVLKPAPAVPRSVADLKQLAEQPDRRSRKRLVYDHGRDVISIRDYLLGGPPDEEEHVEARPIRRKKSVQRGRGRQQKTVLTLPKEQKRVIRIEGESIQVAELAHRLSVKGADLVKKLMGMGVMVSVNQAIDIDTATIVASEYGYNVEKVGFDPAALLAEKPDDPADLRPRPPVVTIMGHVDHGKTTLLDRIRKSRVAESEAGGITQHIGAYKVTTPGGDIVFLDTPGHEAFTAMRARGAKATDIVVLVVAADDGVMAQTKEAIAHARDGGAPIIVAINKIDKPEARPERVRQELAKEGILAEEWGGDNIFVEISARQGIGIDALLEAILLQAEMLELKANPNKPGRGLVLESQLHPQLGPVATVLVQSGTLRVGDVVMAGLAHGRIRMMQDHAGNPVQEAGPSTPVRVAGLNVVPGAGDQFAVLPDEKKAREVAEWQVEQLKRARAASTGARVSLEDFFSMAQAGSVKELKLIVRADVYGSLAPIIESIGKLKHPQVSVKVIHSAVGNITESDVNLAIAANAVIVGFNVSVDPKAAQLADAEHVDIKRYSVIYDVVDNIRKAMEGLLAPKLVAKLVGKAEVRKVINISKVGRIAGSQVISGHALRNAEVKVMRGREKVFEGKVASLKHFKEDVREVKQGLECGIALEGFDGIEAGDIIEFYEYESVRESISPVRDGD